MRLETVGEAVLPEPGSEEACITEHHWGYSGGAGRPTREYQVEHPRWAVRRAVVAGTSGPLEPVYGPELGAVLTGAPRSAFLAEGSPVVVRRAITLD